LHNVGKGTLSKFVLELKSERYIAEIVNKVLTGKLASFS